MYHYSNSDIPIIHNHMEKEYAQGIANAVLPLIEELYKTVRTYCSDTFDADIAKLTDAEAINITTTLIRASLNERIDCESLDGVMLSGLLAEIRDEEDGEYA